MSTPTAPMKPRFMKSQLERSVDELRLWHRSRQWAAGCFMLLWLTGWTVGCVVLAWQFFVKRELSMLLFGVPFWASWLFVFFMLLKMFWQEEELVMTRGGVAFARRVLVVIRRRLIPLAEMKAIDDCIVKSDEGAESGLELITLGKSERCFMGMPADELAWVKYELNDCLAGLKGQGSGGGKGGREEAGPPADASWRRVEGFGTVGFERRGRISVSTLFGLLFINAFWNGIVSVFVAGLIGVMPGEGNPVIGSIGWWGLFFFLIPFEVIGLAMFGGLMAHVLEPVHRTVWTFGDQRIELRHLWFGIGRRWSWEVDRLDRMEVRRQSPGSKRWLRWGGDNEGEVKDVYEVLFIDRGNSEVCRMDSSLTEGEAQWVCETLRQERRAWFG